MSFFDIKSPSATAVEAAAIYGSYATRYITGATMTSSVATSSMTAAFVRARKMELPEFKKLASEVEEHGYTLEVGMQNKWELQDMMTQVPLYDDARQTHLFQLEDIRMMLSSGSLDVQPWNPVIAAIDLIYPTLDPTQRHEVTLIAREYISRLRLAIDNYERVVQANKALIQFSLLRIGTANPLIFAQYEDPE